MLTASYAWMSRYHLYRSEVQSPDLRIVENVGQELMISCMVSPTAGAGGVAASVFVDEVARGPFYLLDEAVSGFVWEHKARRCHAAAICGPEPMKVRFNEDTSVQRRGSIRADPIGCFYGSGI